MLNTKKYDRPVLRRWGNVSDLTLGGGGSSLDGGNAGLNNGVGNTNINEGNQDHSGNGP